MGRQKQLNEHLRKLIKSKREEKGLSQNKLAKEIDCAPSTLSKFQRGEVGLKAHSIKLLCEKLDITPNELFNVPDANEPNTENRVTWIERTPRYLHHVNDDGALAEEIKTGIDIFRQLIVERKSADQIVAEREEQGLPADQQLLRQLLIVTVRHGGLQLIQIERHRDLEAEVRKKYDLPDHTVYVVKLPDGQNGPLDSRIVRTELVALLAGKIIRLRHHADSQIFVSGGYTLARMTESYIGSNTYQFQGTTWIPLESNRGPEAGMRKKSLMNYSALRVADTLARHFPNSETRNYRPEMTIQYPMAALVSCAFAFPSDSIHPLLEEIDFFGQKSPDLLEAAYEVLRKLERDKDVAAMIHCRLYDRDGERFEIPEVEKIFDDSLNRVPREAVDRLLSRGRPVWLVAGGGYKCEAVKIAIDNGIANHFVIDSQIANYILR